MCYPLFAALERGHLTVASLLLDQGADINIQEQSRRYPALHEAVERGDTTSMAFLIQKNAELDICDSGHQPPLHLAVQKFATEQSPTNFITNCIELLSDSGEELRHLPRGDAD
jgi:ankyrin repeat protein